ncbi:hypothetical protein MBLNU459_g3343t1 [Dothideomycetes sp. NU459]
MADPRAFLTLILLLFILFSPNPGPDPLQRTPSRYQANLNASRSNLATLNRTRYGDFDPAHDRWLNITGCGEEPAFAWGVLASWKERARKLSAHALGEENVGLLDGHATSGGGGGGEGSSSAMAGGDVAQLPLYRNVTGVLRGDWVRSPLQTQVVAPVLNMSRYAPEGPFGPMPLSGFGRNVTGAGGALRVWLHEADYEDTTGMTVDRQGREVAAVREISAQVTVQDDAGLGDEWEAQMYGVHFLQTGNVVLATTSDKFAGIFALPHMMVSEHEYGLAQALLDRSLATTIHRQEAREIHSFNPWASAPETNNGFVSPTCDLVIYLQQHLVAIAPGGTAAEQSSLLDFIEHELRFPTGASGLPTPVGTHFSFLAFSPDCGYVIESKGPPDYAPQEGDHLTGLKTEVAITRARHHLLVFAGIVIAQLLLLKRQMRDASTPSTRSRISFYAISIMAMGDGFTFGAFCMTSVFIQSMWAPLIATGFFAFMSVSFFGMRFLMDIWIVQAPEREERERVRREAMIAARAASAERMQAYLASRAANQPATTTATAVDAADPAPSPDTTTIPTSESPQAPIITPAGADTLPLPATARRPVDTGATPVFMPSDQEGLELAAQPGITTAGDGTATEQDRAAGFGATYTRFYLVLLASMFLSLNASSWPAPFRRFYFTTLAFLYLSFWVPQIHRNALRNCRKALRWDFVAGQSLLRLVPFAYFYGYSGNALFADVDLTDLAVLAGWVWAQVMLLASQEVLGPRWFIRGNWVPPAYDYHPILREDEEGGNMPVGASQALASTPSSPTLTAKGPGDSVDKGKRTFDCAICMQEFEVPVLGKDGAGGAEAGGIASGTELVFARRLYMVTPCRHIFHAACLEGWMKYRLQCPICREQLPPM